MSTLDMEYNMATSNEALTFLFREERKFGMVAKHIAVTPITVVQQIIARINIYTDSGLASAKKAVY